MFIVDDIDTMEAIVAKRHDLIWDSWDVIKLVRRTPTAVQHADGMRLNGRWFRTQRFKLESNGWTLPDEYRLVK